MNLLKTNIEGVKVSQVKMKTEVKNMISSNIQTEITKLRTSVNTSSNKIHDKNKVNSAVKNFAASTGVPRREPLTASLLATASASEQKQMIGERLFTLVLKHQPHLAGKITGMLLEIDNSELLNMLESRDLLSAKVDEAVQVLQAHQAKEAAAAATQATGAN